MKEFEPILLKKLIYSSEYFKKVMPILKKTYFADIGNQQLYSLIGEYYSKYKELPSLTELVTKVKDVPNAEVRKSIVDALKVISATEEVKNIDFMIEETVSWVKDSLYFEALQLGSDGLMKKDDNLKLRAQQLLDERSKITIDSDLGLDFDEIDEMIDYYSTKMIGIKTQHKELNKRLGPGFLPGTLSLILAASGIGKSLLKTDLISYQIKQKRNVLLVSLEMSDKEVMKRVHANALDIPINSLLDLAKSPGEINNYVKENPSYKPVTKEMVLSAYNELKLSGNAGKLYVKDYPAGAFTPLMLEQLVESYKMEKGITFDIVFVDYMGIMKSDLISPSAGLYSYVKSIAEELRAVAKKLKLPIVSSSQLNRGAIGDTENANNANVSDSIGSVMTADWMCFLLQDDNLKEKNEIVCKVTKNRFNGRTDTWGMNVDYEHMRFHDMIVADGSVSVEEINTMIAPIGSTIDDDFGIINKEKQKNYEDFAKTEIREIIQSDMEILNKQDPMNNADDVLKELGLI